MIFMHGFRFILCPGENVLSLCPWLYSGRVVSSNIVKHPNNTDKSGNNEIFLSFDGFLCSSLITLTLFVVVVTMI